MSLFGSKHKHKGGGEDHVNSLAWMVSYADMATILLAMFIVLSSFSKDQTGLTLYHGTGSFDRATKSFGLPGLLPNGSRMVPQSNSGPAHSFAQPAEWRKNKTEPDPNTLDRVIDSEEERFQHFLAELGQTVPVDKLPRPLGQATIDLFEPLDRNPPYLKEFHRKQILPLLPLLGGKQRIQVVVWAGMPVESALVRASTQADAIVAGLAADARPTPDARSRLVGVGQCWSYRDVRRPVVSFVVTRTE